MLDTIAEWAWARDAIRAVLLTSTRAIQHGRVDALSDYDVILVVEDITRSRMIALDHRFR